MTRPRDPRPAPDGVDRIIEVSFSDNVDLDAARRQAGAVIAAYATRPTGPAAVWPMLFDNITIRLLGSDDFPHAAKRQAAIDLTAAAAVGAVLAVVAEALQLDRVAAAHDLVDSGVRGRVLVDLTK